VGRELLAVVSASDSSGGYCGSQAGAPGPEGRVLLLEGIAGGSDMFDGLIETNLTM